MRYILKIYSIGKKKHLIISDVDKWYIGQAPSPLGGGEMEPGHPTSVSTKLAHQARQANASFFTEDWLVSEEKS